MFSLSHTIFPLVVLAKAFLTISTSVMEFDSISDHIPPFVVDPNPQTQKYTIFHLLPHYQLLFAVVLLVNDL